MKSILLVISFLFAISLNAQYDWTEGTIYLKNGDTHKGFVKLPVHSAGLEVGNNKVKFRKNEDAKKKKFDEKQVEKIILVNEEGEQMEFRLLHVNKRKKELYHIIVDGKTKLYGRKVSISGGGMWIGGFPSTTVAAPGHAPVTVPASPAVFIPGFVRNYNEMMVYGPGDEEPVNLIPTGWGSFRKKAMEYFSDCPELAKKIEEKIYKKEDLKQVVSEYNDCK